MSKIFLSSSLSLEKNIQNCSLQLIEKNICQTRKSQFYRVWAILSQPIAHGLIAMSELVELFLIIAGIEYRQLKISGDPSIAPFN